MGFRPICPRCQLVQAHPAGERCEACNTRLYPVEHGESAANGGPAAAQAPSRERFTVGSVTGYTIGRGGSNGSRHIASFWYVYDRAYCYRIVQEFRGFGGRSVLMEHAAREHAERLNSGLR